MTPEALAASDYLLHVELENTEAAYRASCEATNVLRVERNRLVGLALAEGWTHQRIADATGLTRSRINQIK